MAEIGLYALRLAFCTALAGTVAGAIAGAKASADLARVARRAVFLTLAFTTVAAGALTWCLVTGDYALAYVSRHSASSMTLPYRIAALWGGQGGSLLLWVWISLLYAAAATWIHREGQRRLAAELTRLVHGAEGLAVAQRATDIFFGAEIDELTDAQLASIFADVPSRTLARGRLEGDGLPLVDALCEAGLARSKSDARRFVTQGGAYVNNRRVDRLDARLGPADLASETTIVLRCGKKNYALLRFTE